MTTIYEENYEVGESDEVITSPSNSKGLGQLIRFDYHALKMPQPAGCTVGVPAEITNITKLK